MKEVDYSIRRPASFLFVGMVGIAFSLLSFTYCFLQAQDDIAMQILVSFVFVSTLILSILLIMSKINFRIIIDKNKTYIRNWLRIEKMYDTSTIKVVAIRPRHSKNSRFYLLVSKKRIAKVYENDINVGLLVNFEMINKS